MATIDMTQRKLRFPPRFIPYLERHRIFELFHECVEMLVQVKPKDHIQFLKNMLPCASKKKDKQRIVFLSPISFDRESFSSLLADCLDIQKVNLMNLETLTRNKQADEMVKIQAMSESESLEEESCICPGEFEQPPQQPLYYPAASEIGYFFDSYGSEQADIIEEQSFGEITEPEVQPEPTEGPRPETEEGMGPLVICGEDEKEEEGEGKGPCICVCPCKKKLLTSGEEGVELQKEIMRLKREKEEMKEDKSDAKDDTAKVEERSAAKEETAEAKEESLSVKDQKGKERAKVKGRRITTKGGITRAQTKGRKHSKKTSSQATEVTEDLEDEGEETWTYYPCVPHRHRRRDSKDKPPPWMSPILSSSVIEIDYGILKECDLISKGWILEDFPMSGSEAEKLTANGVLPTHALRVIVNEEEEDKNQEYKLIVKSWMEAYKYLPAVEIRVNGRSMEELTEDLCSLLSWMPHRHAPMLPRVVIIGCRGSGATTQAQKLATKYGLVHVEYDVVMARALADDDDELSKLYKVQLGTRPDPEVEAVILERALLSTPCRNRGWVLTGYPKNIDQMRMLDIMATPPNRVIFINVPARECFVRLFYRKFDPHLGDEYKLPIIEPDGLHSYKAPSLDPEIAARLVSHPKNNKKQIINDIEKYFSAKNEMKFYCGTTAAYVNGNQEVDRVFELIEHILINPSSPQPPREPLAVQRGIEESYERLKKFRLARGLFFNDLFLNPPENSMRP